MACSTAIGVRPNPRLQRTRVGPSGRRSPLSRQPLGDGKSRRGSWVFLRLMRAAPLAILLLACARQHLQACECADYPSGPVAALKKSGLVFSGEVVAVDTVSLPRVSYTESADHKFVPSQYMARVGVVTLRAIKEWKGNGATQYVVLAGAPPVTPLPPGYVMVDCQVHLELGKRYLVFATEGYAEADYCSRTGELEQRVQDVATLDAYASLSKKPSKARR